jgi:hypothetical protein
MAGVLSWVVVAVFFWNNAARLTRTHDRSTLKPGLLDYVLSHQEGDRIVITNSMDAAYYFPLYTHRRILFKDMTLQPLGYWGHFQVVMRNFAFLGVTRHDFVSLLESHHDDPAYGWLRDRPFSYKDFALYSRFYPDDVLNFGLYRTFNMTMRKEGLITADYLLTADMLQQIDTHYPERIDDVLSMGEFDVILDSTASRILPTRGPEQFQYVRRFLLDDGETVVLEDARPI